MQTIQLGPGDILDDKYRLERELGRGGFSRVYMATQLGMDRPVALKLMTVDLPQRSPDDEDGGHDEQDAVVRLITRFEQEAKLISRLKSPATISVYDYGQTREGLFFMALEFVQGRTLSQLKPPDELPMPPERLVHILDQILVSLKEAHALGVIHRDLKPANIMIYDHMEERDLVKVLDFGIAKIFDAKDGDVPLVDVTRQGVLVGTPRYMAPELINGQAIGPWSDLYALGLICVELLTGQRAIAGKGELELLAWQLGREQVQLPEEVKVPGALRHIVNRLCAKDLSYRYQDAREVLTDLAHWRGPAPAHAGPNAPAARLGATTGADVTATTTMHGELNAAQQAQGFNAKMAIGIVALAIITGISAFAIGKLTAPVEPEAPAPTALIATPEPTPAEAKTQDEPAAPSLPRPPDEPKGPSQAELLLAERDAQLAASQVTKRARDEVAHALRPRPPQPRTNKPRDPRPDTPTDEPTTPVKLDTSAPKVIIESKNKPTRVVEKVEGPLF